MTPHSLLCRYNLELRVYDGPILRGLETALNEYNEVQAVLMGTRRSDPSGQQLDFFQVSSPELGSCAVS